MKSWLQSQFPLYLSRIQTSASLLESPALYTVNKCTRVMTKLYCCWLFLVVVCFSLCLLALIMLTDV